MPAAHSLDALASTIASNTWTKVVADKGVDKAGWGTSAYDPDRRQVLYWGGGHSEYKGTNVMHYSAATNRWSLSDRPDWVLEWTGGFLCPTGLSFNNRPMVPVHGYQAYAYDTLSQELLVQSTTAVWRYDTARRRWIWPPIDAPFRADVMRVSFETTPHGLIVWGNPKAYDGALYRYDPEEKSFEQLPLNGGPIERPWCDGSGLAYDSKRDVLWLATETLHRYDMGSGTLTKAGVTKPSVLGKYALWREQVYVPDADLVLLMRRFGTDEGRFNVAYDPQANKYVSIELPFDDGAERSFSWSSALMYDPASKLVLLHNPISFWVLKLDRSTASISDL